MRRFNFKLEKVLRLRKHIEDEAKIDLGRAVGALNLIEGKIASLAEEHTKAAGERFAFGSGATEIRAFDLYIRRLSQTKDRLLEDAAKASLVVAEKRDTYVETSRDRKVLDKIKDRRRAEHRVSALAEEVSTLDDLSGSQTIRKSFNTL